MRIATACLRDLPQDVKNGWRQLRRSPLTAISAALSLAIGIGANAAIFAVANAILFRPPAGVLAPQELVDIGTARDDGGLNPASYQAYEDIVRHGRSFTGVFAQSMNPRVLSLAAPDSGGAERVVGQYVTPTFFETLGVRPAAGRLFAARDDGAGAVAVLDFNFWHRRFGGDAAVIGRVLFLNGEPFRVVGVAEQPFQGTGFQVQDVWVAIPDNGRGISPVMIGARITPLASVASANAEVAAISKNADSDSETSGPTVTLRALGLTRAGANRNIVGGLATVLMVVVSLVLAIACANTAGLLLARAAARSGELALRTALGAARARLIRQLLTETLLLFVLAGALGVLLAQALLILLPSVFPAALAISANVDANVFMFTAGLSLATALASGLAPAFKASKSAPADALKSVGRSGSGRSRIRRAFVVVQISLCVLLIVLAGMFVRALRFAGFSDPGFDPAGVEMALVDLSMIGADGPARRIAWLQIVEGLAFSPDVESVTLARVPPGGLEGIGIGSVRAGDGAKGELFTPSWNIVSPNYFRTMRIPVTAGRDFTGADTSGSVPVAIIGEGLAGRLWPGQPAVGKYLDVPLFDAAITPPEPRQFLVVGVAKDIKASSLVDGLAASYVYLPTAQNIGGMTVSMTIVARNRGGRSAASLTPEMARVVKSVNSQLVLVRAETLQDAIAYGLTPQRVFATVAGSLGLVGLILTAIGMFGLIAFTVAIRKHEFGIRMALGAGRGQILRIVLGQSLWLVAVGVTVGCTLAGLIGQVLSVFLYGLPALDGRIVAAVFLLFLTIGGIASYVPARHAVGIEPLEALRND